MVKAERRACQREGQVLLVTKDVEEQQACLISLLHSICPGMFEDIHNL